MSKVKPDMKKFANPADIETLGAPAFELCDRFAAESLALGVDFDAQCYEAVFAAFDGKPFEQVLACVDLPAAHPAADRIERALTAVYQSGRGESA